MLSLLNTRRDHEQTGIFHATTGQDESLGLDTEALATQRYDIQSLNEVLSISV